jgi:hypothetical protein
MWPAPDGEAEQEEDQRDRQEGDVAFEEADDRARPAGGGDALHRHEHHAGRRDRREVEPVDVERAPGAVRREEEPRDEGDRAERREREGDRLDARRDRDGR